MRKVISNTTPILSLLKINKLSILGELYGSVSIPQAVFDEIMGRRYAKHLGLNLTGTLGVLLKAKEKGLIDAISPLLTELTQKGTWLNPTLINNVLKLAGER